MSVNICNIYFELWMKDQIEERSLQLVRNLAVAKRKPGKNSGLNAI